MKKKKPLTLWDTAGEILRRYKNPEKPIVFGIFLSVSAIPIYQYGGELGKIVGATFVAFGVLFLLAGLFGFFLPGFLKE